MTYPDGRRKAMSRRLEDRDNRLDEILERLKTVPSSAQSLSVFFNLKVDLVRSYLRMLYEEKFIHRSAWEKPTPPKGRGKTNGAFAAIYSVGHEPDVEAPKRNRSIAHQTPEEVAHRKQMQREWYRHKIDNDPKFKERRKAAAKKRLAKMKRSPEYMIQERNRIALYRMGKKMVAPDPLVAALFGGRKSESA